MQTQAYFDDIQYYIKKELNKANQSICIAVAWFTDKELFSALCEKATDGVGVELIIMNDEINMNSGIEFDLLTKMKGKVWKISSDKDSDILMHNKFCIIDGNTIINGSYNWTNRARQNHESITIISEAPEIALQFLQEFSNIKEKYFGAKTENLVVDYTKLCMRLETLKSVILLEDKEDIQFQTNKINKMISATYTAGRITQVREIISLLGNHQYGDAIPLIDEFLTRFRSLVSYIDPVTAALRLEVKALEIQISSLEDEKAESEKEIHEFERQYNLELGELILRLLKLRKEQLKEEAEDDESKKSEYEEAQRDYEEFQQNYEAVSHEEKYELPPEQLQELKTNYRKASKLCHPDVVAEEYREEAAEIFRELNNAYTKNDLQKVNEILAHLEQGIFKSNAEKVTEKDKLKIIVKKLRIKLTTLEQLINQLKQSETYRTVSTISDWKIYFQGIREQLQSEIHQLENNG